MNIILCGLPGCGKSSVGQLLAKKLNFAFIDTDHRIREHYQSQWGEEKSCQQIFTEKGEAFFRKLESQIIDSLSLCQKSVIATGGGSFIEENNRKALESLGSIVYLKAKPDTIFKRLTNQRIPAYLDPQDPQKSFEKMAQERCLLYTIAANQTIEIDNLSPDAIASSIYHLYSSDIRRPHGC